MNPRRPRKQKKNPHRINDEIRAAQVRLIGEDEVQIGVLPIAEARRLADEAELDLVEVVPQADPPVCKLLVYSKYLYQLQRKERSASKHKVRAPHQIRLQPNIAEHDLATKRNQIMKFLLKGDQVNLLVQMKGRQNAHPELAIELLNGLRDALPAVQSVQPKHAGNRVAMNLMPDKQLVEQYKAQLAKDQSIEEIDETLETNSVSDED